MADYNSSLPVRTEADGSVVSKICDGTTPSQHLAVSAAGEASVKVKNGSADPAGVEVIVSGAPVDPRDIRALTNADVVTVEQGTAAAISGAWPVQPTDGTNSQSYTASGEAKVSVTQPLPAGTNLIGDVESRTQDGSGTGITSGAQGAKQCLDVELSLDGALLSSSNPLPVVVSASESGTDVHDYKTASALAAAATDNHDYTAVGAFHLMQVEASASGKIKVEVKVNGVSKFVGFNSTSTPQVSFILKRDINVAAAQVVRVAVTNLDKAAMDVYSTIVGYEE